MRPLAIAFLLAWIAGVATGSLSIWWNVLTLCLVVVITARYRLKTAYLAGAIAITILGMVYAHSAKIDTLPCDTLTEATAMVINKPRHEASRSIYKVKTKNGCEIQVYANPFPKFQLGDSLQLSSGTYQKTVELDLEFSGFANYLDRSGIGAIWRYPSISLLAKNENAHSSVSERLMTRTRQIFPEPDASIVAAMVFANRDTLPDNFVANARAVGVSHILAPSMRTFFVLLALWGYLAMIDFPTSATRAGLLWSFVLVAYSTALLVSLPTVLLLAVATMLSIYPLYIFDVGFQLSVSAVIGIFLTLMITRTWRDKLSTWAKPILSLITVSAGATLTTWPLISFHFGNLATYSIISNLFIVPIVPFILIISISSLLVSYLSLSAALLGALGVRVLLYWIDYATTIIASAPFALISDTHISLALMIAYYFSMLIVFAATMRASQRSWREIWQ
jgi:competence protein ComEC